MRKKVGRSKKWVQWVKALGANTDLVNGTGDQAVHIFPALEDLGERGAKGGGCLNGRKTDLS